MGLYFGISVEAHPRSRGENHVHSRCALSDRGSSPLTRGKRSYGEAGSTWDGLIPAHAGKTRKVNRVSGQGRAHPRSRGENPQGVIIDRDISGSSPLTRGKLGRLEFQERTAGLIPAHAGKTCFLGLIGSLVGAHPRSRGENRRPRSYASRALGSSPLTRGKQDVDVPVLLHDGLIPAHAGKTFSRQKSRAHPKAHPRSRGENGAAKNAPPFCGGSSPLTRGKPWCALSWLARLGLIPAHAGKTRRRP